MVIVAGADCGGENSHGFFPFHWMQPRIEGCTETSAQGRWLS